MEEKEVLQEKFIKGIKQCNYEMVLEAHKNGADPYLTNNGDIPIKLALHCSSESIAYFLFGVGVHKKYGMKLNQEFLQLAAKKGYHQVVNIILRDTDFSSETLDKTLFHAAESGDMLTLDSLLNKGANINIEDYRGDIPLFTAIEKGHLNATLYLIRGGANIFNLNKNNENALLIATKTSENIEIVRFLLQRGLDVNHQDIYGNTSLINTFCSIELNFENDFSKVVGEIIHANADINTSDNSNRSVLMYACMFASYHDYIGENSDLIFWIKEFLAKGIDVKKRDDFGKSALDYAIENDFQEAITLIENYLQIKRPNLNVKESNCGISSQENFKDNSFLSRNGYTTKKNSEERWDVLSEKILPNYSTQNIINFMGTMIRRYRSQKDRRNMHRQ
jgi:ankyrin repeat protein